MAVPEAIWVGTGAGLVLLVVGAVGLWTGYPLLFPSLGPTIALQAHTPQLDSARPYNVVVGHGVGIAVAMGAVVLVGASSAPPVLSSESLTWARVLAAVVGLSIGTAVQIALRATHPPAAATILLITLGGFAVRWQDAAVLAAGVLLTAVLGEIVRRMKPSR